MSSSALCPDLGDEATLLAIVAAVAAAPGVARLAPVDYLGNPVSVSLPTRLLKGIAVGPTGLELSLIAHDNPLRAAASAHAAVAAVTGGARPVHVIVTGLAADVLPAWDQLSLGETRP